MNISLEKQFLQPLEYIDVTLRRHLYKRVIIKASLCIIFGLTIFFLLPLVLPVLDPNVRYGARRNDGAIGFILICLAIGLPPYGLWLLVTIKNRAGNLARKELLMHNPKFAPYEASLKNKSAMKINRALKITTVIVSIVVVILIFVASFLLLSYK